jgi:ACS family hexuronate transporter-like MFS transporter
VWLIFWFRYYEVPAKQARINQAEFDYIHSDNEPDTSKESPVKWLDLFKVRQTWAFVFGKMLTDPIWWFFLYWLPSYFAEAFKLNLSKPSPELVIVYTATTIGSIGGGYLSGYFIKKGWPIFRARKTSMLIFAFLVTPIMLAQYTTNIWQAVILISLSCCGASGVECQHLYHGLRHVSQEGGELDSRHWRYGGISRRHCFSAFSRDYPRQLQSSG